MEEVQKVDLIKRLLQCMMYGFGDDHNPCTEPVDIPEDLVIVSITGMTQGNVNWKTGSSAN